MVGPLGCLFIPYTTVRLGKDRVVTFPGVAYEIESASEIEMRGFS